MECDKSIAVFYTLLYILVIILTSIVIKEGKSEQKMVSWTLYSFSIIFGLIALGLLWFLKCGDGSQTKAKKWTIPVLTVTLTLANMIGMILAKPDLPVSQLFVPHFTNVILLISSVFMGISICGQN